jgi:A/G-specific adenine glycosylase
MKFARAPDDCRLSDRLLAWYQDHGRHDLPWQREVTSYRVWLSEVMLQQTQVTTVIPYFEQFVETFPDVRSLAAAPLDAVLHRWSGLGYYSRARNLHKTARIVAGEHAGEFPQTLEGLTALPGIGRSTAGAILALVHGLPVAILDGNVKRVLARYHAVEGWPGQAQVLRELWAMSERHVPPDNARDYTQAIMDLGATVCTRKHPRCSICPLHGDCAARHANRIASIPASRPKRKQPERRTYFLVIENGAGAILLQRRPPSGVWGGLWSCPEIADESELSERIASLGFRDATVRERMHVMAHGFTHFKLEIRPLRIDARGTLDRVHDTDDLCWYSGQDSTRIGVSAAVSRLLDTLRSNTS